MSSCVNGSRLLRWGSNKSATIRRYLVPSQMCMIGSPLLLREGLPEGLFQRAQVFNVGDSRS